MEHEPTAGDDAGRSDARDHRSLLERAGVIGAEVIAPDDPGNRFIPVAVPTSTDSPPDRNEGSSWVAAGIPDQDIARWQRVGATPTTAATLWRLGADPEAVGAAPVSADELVGWLWHGFAIEQVADWLVHGSVRIAARRRDAGLPPGDADPLRRAADDPVQARTRVS